MAEVDIQPGGCNRATTVVVEGVVEGVVVEGVVVVDGEVAYDLSF